MPPTYNISVANPLEAPITPSAARFKILLGPIKIEPVETYIDSHGAARDPRYCPLVVGSILELINNELLLLDITHSPI